MNRLPALSVLLLTACATTSWKRADGLEIRTFTYESSSVHLVTKDGVGFLVDGGYEKHGAELAEAVLKAGVEPSKLKAIILTHGHADHAGGARILRDKLHVPIVVGAGDVELLSKGQNEPPFCPNGFIARMRVSEDGAATYTPFSANLVLNENTDLATLTGIPGKVVLVPGHTKGSLYVVVGDVALVGDLMRGSVIGSGAETHLYMCDLEANKRDVATLLNTEAPGATLIFPAHFGPLTREAVAEKFDVKVPAK